jgi:hypothetical protein
MTSLLRSLTLLATGKKIARILFWHDRSSAIQNFRSDL